MSGKISFGKYKGTKFENIPADYLLWLWDQNWLEDKYPEAAKYISENIDWIELEADKNG
jgi:uncharacterized protein (DUF3820 family)